MPRFVLLYHDCPAGFERPSHWDFMLEVGDVLQTWSLARLPEAWGELRAQTVLRVTDCPVLASEQRVAALQLADHRLEYLQKEGPLSGGRGDVIRIESGAYTIEFETPVRREIIIDGMYWGGLITFERKAVDFQDWTLTAHQPAG